MNRPHRVWSRSAGALLPVLLIVAQSTTALGLPAFAKPSARTTPCGCPLDTDRPASCCCSTGAKAGLIGEGESCCAKPKPKAAPLAAMLARGCYHHDGPLGLPVLEPAVPPVAPAAVPCVEPKTAAVLAASATTISLPTIPPDPPPRAIG